MKKPEKVSKKGIYKLKLAKTSNQKLKPYNKDIKQNF